MLTGGFSASRAQQCDFSRTESEIHEGLETDHRKVGDYHLEEGVVRIVSQVYVPIHDDESYGTLRVVIIADSPENFGWKANSITFFDKEVGVQRVKYTQYEAFKKRGRVGIGSIFRVKGMLGYGSGAVRVDDLQTIELRSIGDETIQVKDNIGVISDQIKCIRSII